MKFSLCIGLVYFLSLNMVYANETATISEAEEILIQAKLELENARKISAQMIMEAKIKSNNLLSHQIEEKEPLKLDEVKNEIISINVSKVEIYKVLTEIMPNNWQVMLDIPQELKEKKITFIGIKSRNDLLNEIAGLLQLDFRYYFDMVSSDGKNKPLLIVVNK